MAWKPEYILLLILSTCVDYYAGLKMGKELDKKKRKKYLYISLLTNLGLLFTFKYFNFFNSTLREVFQKLHISYNVPDFSLLLPMGISFYTFQTLSYTIDVYRGKIKPEKHFGIFALYVTFFPQLVAGPIERSGRLLPQFLDDHPFDSNKVTSGAKLMIWGFFKKLVIADRFAIVVNQVYNNPIEYQGIQLVIATILFSFQIYCDFSGYTDIAIGAARIMGFDLMQNFERPYYAKSISEFWKRWHISLSEWFKDYLYIPMGGNRVRKHRRYFNIFFVFLLSGFWHGANWTFIIWGSLHGLYLIVEILTASLREKLVNILGLRKFPFIYKIIRISITFGLVCFAWIFFRANNVHDSIYIIKNLFVGVKEQLATLTTFKKSLSKLKIGNYELLIILLSICIMELAHIIERKGNILVNISKYPLLIRWSIYYLIIFFILFFGVFASQEFIYFQF